MLRFALCLTVLLPACSGAQRPPSDAPLPACEGCGATEAPGGLTAAMRLPPPDEPGTPLVVTGTVYEPDGRTPAPGVLMYAYHTNAAGDYPMRGDERGNARRHGYLRGWLMTDSAGRYSIHTIRPGAYPGRADPQHIHVTFTPPGRREQWADEVLFADDPRLRAPAERPAGQAEAAVLQVQRAPDGTERARHDFVIDSGSTREMGAYIRPPGGQ